LPEGSDRGAVGRVDVWTAGAGPLPAPAASPGNPELTGSPPRGRGWRSRRR